jgi:hypothetical protein
MPAPRPPSPTRQVRGDYPGAPLVLIALKEFLLDASRADTESRGGAAGVPLVEVAPYGVAMLQAAKRVLESGDTPYLLLPPLLAVLPMMAAHHAACVSHPSRKSNLRRRNQTGILMPSVHLHARVLWSVRAERRASFGRGGSHDSLVAYPRALPRLSGLRHRRYAAAAAWYTRAVRCPEDVLSGISSSACENRFAPRFTELMDLLLGWALEPSLPPRTRVALLSTFAADHVRAHWAANLEFSSRLAHKVRRVPLAAPRESIEAAPNPSIVK